MKVLFLNPQQEMGGVQCLSSFLKKHDHETALVNDPNLFDNPWIQYKWLSRLFDNTDEILSRIEKYNPDLIALTVVTDDYAWALKWANEIKKHFNIPIVAGNTHPTFKPADCLSHGCIDYIVRGEGELTLLELLDAIEGKIPFNKVLGLGHKLNGKPTLNPMRPLIEDMDILPFPDKDLYYHEMPYLNHGYTTMSGRGCPYKCTFCDNNTSMKLYKTEVSKVQKWTRRHSPEYVVEEILWAKEKYNISHVRFNDEDFSYDRKWLKQFCLLYKEKVGIPYFAWVYPNTIDEEMADLLASSGCDAVELGIQSGSAQLRKEILHRGTKDSQIVRSCCALRKAGIRTTVDIIIGLPTETKENLDDTVKLLMECNPWHLYAFWLRYYPTTEILQIAKEKKLLTPENINKLEQGGDTRGHIAGGTELEKDSISRHYHAFIVMIPLMPNWFIGLCLKYDIIRFTPTMISPFLLVNLTKVIKRDPYNEFRVRGWLMIYHEGSRLIFKLFRKTLLKPFASKKEFKMKSRKS